MFWFWFWFPLLVLAIFHTIKLLRSIHHQYRLYVSLKHLPGPEFRFGFWGCTNLLLNILWNFPEGQQSKEFIKLLERLSDQYDPGQKYGLYRIWLGPFVPFVVITDPGIVQKLLNSGQHLDKASFYSIFRLGIYDGIFSCNKERWQKNKHELIEHLKFKSLNRYIPNTQRQLAILNHRIDQCIKENDGYFADIKPIISTFTLDLLGENLFGHKFESQISNKEPELVLCVHQLLTWAYEAFLMPWTFSFNTRFFAYFNAIISIKNIMKYRMILRYHRAVRKIIIDRFKQIVSSSSPKELTTNPLMLDAMILARIPSKNLAENRNPKSVKIMRLRDIESQINTFVIAGHDTTTSSLTWTLYLLGHHADKQQKLIKEIDQFLNNLHSKQEPLTLLNMRRLKYLDACILETLRLYPSGPFIGRRSRQSMPIKSQDGERVQLPAKVDCIIFIYHMHLNRKYFRHPHRFIPERFLANETDLDADDDDDDAEGPWFTPSAYLPFSGGLRMCLGKEYSMVQQRMFFINLFSRFTIKSMDQYGQCQPGFDFLLSSAHFPLRFQNR